MFYISVPLPVLILGPNKPEHVDLYKDMKGGDLCENVTYLGMKLNIMITYLSFKQPVDQRCLFLGE